MNKREYGDICPLLDVDDMVKMKKPDWKCVFTYVQSFYRRFRGGRERPQPAPRQAPITTDENVRRTDECDMLRPPQAEVAFKLRPEETLKPYEIFENLTIQPLPKTNFGEAGSSSSLRSPAATRMFAGFTSESKYANDVIFEDENYRVTAIPILVHQTTTKRHVQRLACSPNDRTRDDGHVRVIRQINDPIPFHLTALTRPVVAVDARPPPHPAARRPCGQRPPSMRQRSASPSTKIASRRRSPSPVRIRKAGTPPMPRTAPPPLP